MKPYSVILILLSLLLLSACRAAGGPGAAPAGTAASTEGTAAAQTASTQAHVTGEVPVPPETPAIDLQWDRVWRSEQEDVPGEGSLVRELVIGYNEFSFTFRCGDPNSEFSYWAAGGWTLEGDVLRLSGIETEEGWEPLADAESFEAVYRVVSDGDKLTLTLCSDLGLGPDMFGVPVVYSVIQEDDHGSQGGRHLPGQHG
jgi:hypothetical protein